MLPNFLEVSTNQQTFVAISYYFYAGPVGHHIHLNFTSPSDVLDKMREMQLHARNELEKDSDISLHTSYGSTYIGYGILVYFISPRVDGS